jgi:glycosyltransferase involved in cell wall biosynthesis
MTKISVLIPAYNAAATIQATLDSALNQTIRPSEILVVDDGCTDRTASILSSYGDKITVISQANAGAATSRNRLCEMAGGDLIAFLDADDIWHPRYLDHQVKLFNRFPQAAGFFTGHRDFREDNYEWNGCDTADGATTQSLTPASFLKIYNLSPAPFSSMSYFCMPMRILKQFGNQPFQANGAEDSYLFNLLPTAGPVVYDPTPLVAYRITNGSMSSDLLRCIGARVDAFKILQREYESCSSKNLLPLFMIAFASHRRLYGRLLMGAGRRDEARSQFRYAIRCTRQVSSRIKSIGYLTATYVRTTLQPQWPSSRRTLEIPAVGGSNSDGASNNPGSHP